MLRYTEEKTFTQEQVQQLFLSVGWVSGQYPQRLYKALMHSSTVLTVWDGDKLAQNVRGREFAQPFRLNDRNGRLVASTAQEGLIRVMPDPATTRTAAAKE